MESVTSVTWLCRRNGDGVLPVPLPMLHRGYAVRGSRVQDRDLCSDISGQTSWFLTQYLLLHSCIALSHIHTLHTFHTFHTHTLVMSNADKVTIDKALLRRRFVTWAAFFQWHRNGHPAATPGGVTTATEKGTANDIFKHRNKESEEANERIWRKARRRLGLDETCTTAPASDALPSHQPLLKPSALGLREAAVKRMVGCKDLRLYPEQLKVLLGRLYSRELLHSEHMVLLFRELNVNWSTTEQKRADTGMCHILDLTRREYDTMVSCARGLDQPRFTNETSVHTPCVVAMIVHDLLRGSATTAAVDRLSRYVDDICNGTARHAATWLTSDKISNKIYLKLKWADREDFSAFEDALWRWFNGEDGDESEKDVGDEESDEEETKEEDEEENKEKVEAKPQVDVDEEAEEKDNGRGEERQVEDDEDDKMYDEPAPDEDEPMFTFTREAIDTHIAMERAKEEALLPILDVRMLLPALTESCLDWTLIWEQEQRQRTAQQQPEVIKPRDPRECSAVDLILNVCAHSRHRYSRDMCQSALLYYDRFQAQLCLRDGGTSPPFLDRMMMAWAALSCAVKMQKRFYSQTLHPLGLTPMAFYPFKCDVEWIPAPDMRRVFEAELTFFQVLKYDLYCMTPGRWLWSLLRRLPSEDDNLWTLVMYNRATQLIDFQLRNFVHPRASTVGATAFDLVYLARVEPQQAEELRGEICSLLHTTPADYASWKARVADAVQTLPLLDTSNVVVPAEGDELDNYHLDHFPELEKKQQAWERRQARLPKEKQKPFTVSAEVLLKEQRFIDMLRPHEWQLVDASIVMRPGEVDERAAVEVKVKESQEDENDEDHVSLPDDTEMYDIEEKRGSGGYGQVFVCHKKGTTDDRRYALKMFDQDDAHRLDKGMDETTMRELSMMTALQTVGKHMHSTMSIEGVYRDVRAMVMPLHARSLDQLLEGFRVIGERMSFVHIKHAFTRVVCAVERCHAIGVWHRDLKPGNIMVSDDLQHVVLADFGMSRIETDDRHIYSRDIGSPEYTAPEVAHTQMYSSSCDIWGLGVILWELITCNLLNVRRVLGPWRCTMRHHSGERAILHDPRSRAKVKKEGEVRETVRRACKRFTKAEQNELVAVLMACLQYEFDERPTATELLQFAFCMGFC